MADVATPTTGPFAVLAQASELWAKQPKRRKTLAIAVIVGVIGVIGYMTLFKHADVWVPVSETASPSETSTIYALLQARDIPVHLHDGKVEVQAERASEARSIAAASGVLTGIGGLETVTDENIGTTTVAEQVNLQRGLQGELEKMITGLAQVQRARVMIAFGHHSPFKDQEQQPSASVAVALHPGQILTAQQVQGIRQLVAKSISGLKAEEVVVIDQYGNLLLAGDSSDADRKVALERTTTVNVRHMLETVVGEGKVSVVATVDFDTTKTNETEETYDKDNPVVRSESRNVEGPNAAAGIGGVAGTQGNLPGAGGPTATTAAGAGKLSETKNYEISRKVRQTEGQNGVLKKLHVAIIVDTKHENGKSVERTPAELAQLTTIAHTAAGFDEARGDTLELASMEFASDAAPAVTAPVVPAEWTEQLPLPLPIMIAIAGGVVLLLVGGAFVLLVRRSRRKARREAAEAMPIALPAPLADLERVLEARPAHPSLAPAAIAEIALPAGPSVQERVLTAVRGDVERAAAVLTSWLAEPPPKGAKP